MHARKLRSARPEPGRRDGWTPVRQLRFLEILLLTRSVTKAAGAAGMSRESAHRLRSRDPRGLFALAWDRALSAGEVTVIRTEVHEGHIRTVRLRSAPDSATRRSRARHREHCDLQARFNCGTAPPA